MRTTGNKGWYAFFLSLPIGLLIGYGIFLLTAKVFVSAVLGLGIYGVVYFTVVGITVLSNVAVSIRKQLDEIKELLKQNL
ncbi:MAG: hypothetical protein Q8R36_04560 [bacterium]|nr:hypothetical protein [bacterium]